RTFEGRIESRFFKDLVYSFGSIAVTLLILTFLVVCLTILYGGRIPLVSSNYITFQVYLYSLLNTEWIKLSFIPVTGTLLKGAGRQIKLTLTRRLYQIRREHIRSDP
ncbi:MAG: hypothetical protein QXL67_02735, partial [Candidatus Bathyarchaeia archaeon]